MTPSIRKLAGRLVVALVLVLLAAGSVVGAAATLPTPAAAPHPAEPAETASAKPTESPEATEAPDTDNDANELPAATNAPKATEAPDTNKDESPAASPSAANLARTVERLAAAGITTTADDLAALAGKVGVGGAVRVLRFADASGKTPAEIVAMFEAGKGWGVIARELKLDIGPGNGTVMGHGRGRDKAAKAASAALQHPHGPSH